MSPELKASIEESLKQLRKTAGVCFNEPTPDVTAATTIAQAITKIQQLMGGTKPVPPKK